MDLGEYETAVCHLPAEWVADDRRRARAGAPDDVGFATKPQLAVQILVELQTAAALPG